MKKLIAALLLLVLAFTCFVACGDETTVTLDDAKTYLQNMLNADDGKETPRDYNVVAKIIIEGVSFDVTWTTDNDKIQVTESDKASFWKIDVPESNDTAFSYKITATIKNADGESVQISFNRKLPVYDNAGIVSDLQENTAYRFFMYQANKQNYYFALAEIDSQGKYYETTTTAADAADFYAEKSGEGYKFYTLIDGTKNYVDAYLDITTADDGTTKTSKRLQFSTDDGDVWTYNGETNGWYTTIDGTQYVIGTYGTYTTFSISEGTYLSKDNTGKSQFPAGFMTPAYAESLKPSEGPTIYTTPEEIVNAAYALEKGAMLSGGYEYTLTGVITAVNTPYDSGYGNVTVTIVVGDMTDKPIECFRLSGTGADVIAVGDEITVTGEILKYDNQTETGKVEFNSGCTLVAYPGSDNVTPGPDTPSDKTWGVVTELKTGDQVLIGAPAYGKLLSVTKVATYYNAGIDYSPTNFANVTDDEIFVVTVNDDGSYTFTSLSGKVIALAAEFSSLNDAGENKSWTLEAKEGATGIYYMKNTGREGYYLEWYASKDNWSTYNGTLSDLFELSFYAIGGTVTPDNGGNETPDQGGDNTDTPTTDAPVADTAYKLAVAQNSLGKTLYFTGATESETVTYRLALTENVAEAVDVYVELVDGVEGAYKLYFMNGETKTYIVVAEYQDGDAGYGKGTITFETATDLYYTYDATAKTLIYTADADNSYYLGTYGTFTTISCSNTSYITGNNAANVDGTQFPARLVVVTDDGGNETPDTHEHNYVDGKCECGAEDPNYVPDQGGDDVTGGDETASTATISFADKANRVSQDTESQVWVQNGITVTNNKGDSTSNVADYADPARFYKNTTFKVEYTGMTKIVFVCNTASYATNLGQTLTDAGITCTVDGNNVTVEFDTAQNSIEFKMTVAQIRMDSIEVYA